MAGRIPTLADLGDVSGKRVLVRTDFNVPMENGEITDDFRTRKALLGHASGDITTHYSAAELSALLDAAEMVPDRGRAQSPTLTVIKRQ